MARWIAADGTKVEVINMTLTAPRNMQTRSPAPYEGEQFSVTEPHGFHVGYYRTVDELAKVVDLESLKLVDESC